MPGYYDGLSGDSSSDHGSCSSESDRDDELPETSPTSTSRREIWAQQKASVKQHSGLPSSPLKQQLLWDSSDPKQRETSADTNRAILHVDVDCFYCQCEMLDRKLEPSRPIAIGQKHIIVTCNYAARAYGVQKLELREKAYAKCPSLIIYEGSDLERYRVHSQKIYASFRKACKDLNPKINVAKGCMDEMMADVTPLGREMVSAESTTSRQSRRSEIFMYGDNDEDSVELLEDQTGERVTVKSASSLGSNDALSTSPEQEILHEETLVRLASNFALKIRQRILDETGFTTTFGMSTNVLLAKIASGLKKPAHCNILPPRKATGLIQQMPLRKIPGVGSRTVKLLRPLLERRFPSRVRSSDEAVIWTYRDLSQISIESVATALESLPGSNESRMQMARRIQNLCQGVDESVVKDDEGGLSKTVSCENSFRRGTMKSKDDLQKSLEDLYDRLPRLVNNRNQWSTKNPDRAYPICLRLVVRFVVPQSHPSHTRRGRSRPFVTKGKQCRFDGKTFIKLGRAELQADFIRRHIEPLAKMLIYSQGKFDITRVNIALSNFQDVAV